MEMQERRRVKCVVTVLLAWMALIRLFDPALTISTQYWSKKEVYDIVLNSLTVLFYAVLPIFCLLSDIKFGWLKTATASAFIGALCSLIYIVLSLDQVPCGKVGDIIKVAIDPIVLFTRLYFEISILCLGTYQLIEISSNSDQISSYLWCHIWCTNFGTMITEVVICFLKDENNYDTYIFSIHFAVLVIIIVSALLIKKWTIKYNYMMNPLKLISSVLCFALKNKYPLKRSALTYWEETEPSRINLGKAKYGGPFLEKDVESVKTFFSLFFIIAVITMVAFPYQNFGRFERKDGSLLKCFVYRTYFISYCLKLVAIPLYLCIIKPSCSSRIRLTMLQRIGIGITISLISKFGYVMLDLFITYPPYKNTGESVCLLQPEINETMTSMHNILSSYMEVFTIIKSISAIGYLFAVPGCFEFVMAQAPHSMRGLLIGSWSCFIGFYQIAGWMLVKPFEATSEYLNPSCELYVLIMNFLILLVCLISFLGLSHWYKLHSREDVFHAYLIAENHYENEFNRRDYYGSF